MKKPIKFVSVLVTIFLSTVAGNCQQSELTIGDSCFNARNYPCALENYLAGEKKNLVKPDKKAVLEYRIGYCYKMQKDYASSSAYFTRSLSTDPSYQNAYWERGANYKTQGMYKQALEDYDAALRLADTSSEVARISYQVADLYYDNKQYRSALEKALKISDRSEELARYTDKLIGDIYQKLNKHDSALIYFEKARQFYTDKNSYGYATLLSDIGISSNKERRYHYAIENLNAATTISPQFRSAIWGLGDSYYGIKNWDKAIEYYREASALYDNKDQSLLSLWGNIASCYKQKGDYQAYVVAEREKLKYTTNPFGPYYNIACVYYGGLKKPEEAENVLTKSKTIYADSARQLKANGLTDTKYLYDIEKINSLLGLIRLDKKDTARAIKLFNEVLKTNSTDYTANTSLGKIAWERNDVDAVKKYYSKAYAGYYDTLIHSNNYISTVFARKAYIAGYYNRSNYYESDLLTALKFDSLQKEALQMWPAALHLNEYSRKKYAAACVSLIDQGIKKYASDKEYVSNLFTSKAALLPDKDSIGITKALEQAIRVNPENYTAWNNFLVFYQNHDNNTGLKKSEALITQLKKTPAKNGTIISGAYVYKGDFLWRLNKKDDAKAAWNEALVWNSENKDVSSRLALK